MKHATIVYPAKRSGHSTLACITAAFETFITANAYRRNNGEGNLFSVELAGTTTAEDIYGGMFTVRPQKNITEIGKTDLVIVPSMDTDFTHVAPEDDVLIELITMKYKQGAVIVSICSGAFMLAASGLLDGRSCSTHWAHAENFRQQFPKVNLMTDRLITDENGICTNGGAFSFLNLMIYLVEKYYDRETAIFCSKSLQIEMDRNSQSAFSIFTGQKLHGDKMVEDAQKYIESSLGERISVEELSAKFAIGRRNFDRRFIKATGNTPLEYSQSVKIELAKIELEVSRKTVNEVMYE